MKPASRALTVVAEIDPTRRPDLEQRLAAIRADLALPASLPDTHFTRWLILDDVPGGDLPAMLVWESNHDGKAADYLAACATAAGPGLDSLFECCRDYRAGDPAGFPAWIQKRSLRSDAFYCGYRGVSRDQVVNDRKVHDAIRGYVDEHRTELMALPPIEIQERIRAHVRGQGLDASVQGDGDLGYALATGAAYVLGFVLAVLLSPALPFLYWALRTREKADVPDPIDRPVHGQKEHIADEDFIAQNQLTHIVDVKSGRFRLWLLRTVLLVIDVLARTEFVHGDLGGITSIHFGRWVVLPDRRRGIAQPRHRLLFFSNYDGSWDSYLGEFIDRNADGLTAVWSNTVGYPRTSKLTGEGARDEEAFKQWARNHQRRTQVWWSGVRDSSVGNVRTDVWIRRRLGRQLSDTELPEWLKRL